MLSVPTQGTVSRLSMASEESGASPGCVLHSCQLSLWFPKVYPNPCALKRQKLIKLALTQPEGLQTWWAVKGQGRLFYKEAKGIQQPGNWGQANSSLDMRKQGTSTSYSCDKRQVILDVQSSASRSLPGSNHLWGAMICRCFSSTSVNLMRSTVWEEFDKISPSEWQ